MFWQNTAKYATEHPPVDHETWSTNGATSSMGGGRYIADNQNDKIANRSKSSGSKRWKEQKVEPRPKPEKGNGRS